MWDLPYLTRLRIASAIDLPKPPSTVVTFGLGKVPELEKRLSWSGKSIGTLEYLVRIAQARPCICCKAAI
jgi:hypothetical protein